MQTIEMRQDNILTGVGHSSKGNQMKWKQDGYWYKADQFGYESLSEVVTSHLLEASNIVDVTSYQPTTIRYKEKEFRGCYSKDFHKPEELLVPIERLFKNYTSIGLAKQIFMIWGYHYLQIQESSFHYTWTISDAKIKSSQNHLVVSLMSSWMP